jgi:hypothetical protein
VLALSAHSCQLNGSGMQLAHACCASRACKRCTLLRRRHHQPLLMLLLCRWLDLDRGIVAATPTLHRAVIKALQTLPPPQ